MNEEFFPETAEAPAAIGDNLPPKDADPLLARMAETHHPLVDRKQALEAALDRFPEVINDDDTAGQVQDYVKQLMAAMKDIEAQRVAEKEPFRVSAAVVDGFFKPLHARLGDIKKVVQKRHTDFLQRKAEAEEKRRQEVLAEQRRIEADARRKAEEAEEKRRAAEEAQRRAEEARRKAEEEAAAAERRAAEAKARAKQEAEEATRRAAAAAAQAKNDEERRKAAAEAEADRRKREQHQREHEALARLEREEAAESQRKAAEETAAAAAMASTASEDLAAAEALKQADEASAARVRAQRDAEASAAAKSGTRSAYGSHGSLRTLWEFEVVDLGKVPLAKIRAYIPRAAIDQAIRGYIRAGGRDLGDSVRIYEDTKSVVR